ncbi:MAG TPA: hypothetical protein ENK91_00880 [Bacteroidetes bacterium]|nr:hypothetical protein [Bacteroidota bacterium]
MKSRFIGLLILVFFSSSCVLPSKYQKTVDEKNRLIRENASLTYLKEQNKKDKREIKDLKEKLAKTEEVMFEINSKLSAATQKYKNCQDEYDKMLLQNKKLLERAFSEQTNLTEELAEKQKILAEKERNLKKLEANLNDQNLNQQLLKNDLERREKKIDSLRNLLSIKDNKLQSIKDKIKKILSGYSNDDIKIEKRDDGRLYISMSQNLLFAKGSDKLDSKGRAAIISVAKALKSEPSIDIVVEGHTDTDGNADLNWKLSTARALAVTKVLIEYGLMPQKITAAGRGQFQPLYPNDTEANKSKNRRTEIIIEPNLNDILNYLK